MNTENRDNTQLDADSTQTYDWIVTVDSHDGFRVEQQTEWGVCESILQSLKVRYEDQLGMNFGSASFQEAEWSDSKIRGSVNIEWWKDQDNPIDGQSLVNKVVHFTAKPV